MMQRRVDGLMVINPRDDNRYRYLLPIIETGLPVVYIKNSPLEEPVYAVYLDDLTGGYLATDHLISLGHTSIVTILGPINEQCTQKRFSGYQKALKDASIQEQRQLIAHGDWSAESGKNAIENLLSFNVQFSAIFAQNDRMALGAICAIRKAGLRIPQDISIIGYDDLPLTAYYDPPLTTIHQPMEKFGYFGVQLLLEAVIKPGTQPRVIQLEPTLISRETCAPANKDSVIGR
jgi:DNA-binding LacI/PurR family transcriptional regulator